MTRSLLKSKSQGWGLTDYKISRSKSLTWESGSTNKTGITFSSHTLRAHVLIISPWTWIRTALGLTWASALRSLWVVIFSFQTPIAMAASSYSNWTWPCYSLTWNLPVSQIVVPTEADAERTKRGSKKGKEFLPSRQLLSLRKRTILQSCWTKKTKALTTRVVQPIRPWNQEIRETQDNTAKSLLLRTNCTTWLLSGSNWNS